MVRVARWDGDWALLTNPDYYWADDYSFFVGGPRPLVVIDPEDREQVERLVDAYLDGSGGLVDSMQFGLRSLLAPPKPDVYRHVVNAGPGRVQTSICGKVWTPTDDVNVVGKCPTCLSLVSDERWMA